MNFVSSFQARTRTHAPASAACVLLLLALLGARLSSAEPPPIEELPSVTVTAAAPPPNSTLPPTPSPQTIQSLTAADLADTVNAVDVEDAAKYLPSLFLRKRNDGDTQAVLATRTWGVNSSARSLVYADGELLSALIANNNTIGAPRWGLVAPSEIDHIDVLYGPFSAAYPGNSLGAVVNITTRMPDHAEATLTQTEALQSFSLYGTHNSYLTSQLALTLGDRVGPWSFWISANEQDSHDQPLTYVTAATLPANTTGGIIAENKLGQPADLLGANAIQHSDLGSVKIKAAYDFTTHIRATYTLGLWENDTDATVQTFLRDATGLPTYAGQSGFAAGTYHLEEEHVTQNLSIKSTGSGDWNWSAIGTLYNFNQDTQRSPGSTAATAGTALSPAGKVALLGGTGWSTLDLKVERVAPNPLPGAAPSISAGLHTDEYTLVNPTYNTPDWQSGRTFTSLATEGNGKTATDALWAQLVEPVASQLSATIGGRLEHWRAFDGINVNGATTVIQPTEAATDFSPKATLAWTAPGNWTVTASVGNAYRYPTAGELYQLVSTGPIFTSPNANLSPEKVWSEEIKAERKLTHGALRVSFFQEDVTNALVSQYAQLLAGSSTPYQYVMNVGRIRNRGIELFADQDHAGLPNLEVSGSVTYVDSTILEDAGEGQFTSAVGKRAPYVPNWRATGLATYRLPNHLAVTVAGRYSGKQFSTVDNTDVNPHTYGGFDEFFVLDAHFNWSASKHWTASGGVDNLLNRKYFLFHPFPQRTLILQVKYSL